MSNEAWNNGSTWRRTSPRHPECLANVSARTSPTDLASLTHVAALTHLAALTSPTHPTHVASPPLQ